MDASQIVAEIDRKVAASGAKFLVFIKQNDVVSDCLVNFVKDNDLDAHVINISEMTMLDLSDNYYLSPVDVPCICLTETCEILYRGCPENTDWLGGL